MTQIPEERVELIAIMGATGSGKSSFINHVLKKGMQEAEIGHGQESCTSEVMPMPFELDSCKGSIIDTPGFDDTHLTDTQILEKIANWMEATYRSGVKITGILYLRDITQARMTGTVVKNLSMFKKLCGTESLKNVVIVTTKWDAVSNEVGEDREKDLMTKFLQPMFTLGAQQARHNNSAASAQEVLRKVLGNTGCALKLQSELVDEKKTLGETEAGAAVGDEIEKLRAKHETEKEDLKKLMQEETNETIKALLQQEQQKLATVHAKMEQDRQILETNREKQMEEYEKRLQVLADNAGTTPSAVMMKGLTEGAAAFGPMLVQQWQEWKTEQAKEKAEEREYQVKLRKEDQDRQAQQLREQEERQAKLRQEETERSLKQAQDDIVRLRVENSQRRSDCLVM